MTTARLASRLRDGERELSVENRTDSEFATANDARIDSYREASVNYNHSVGIFKVARPTHERPQHFPD